MYLFNKGTNVFFHWIIHERILKQFVQKYYSRAMINIKLIYVNIEADSSDNDTFRIDGDVDDLGQRTRWHC